MERTKEGIAIVVALIVTGYFFFVMPQPPVTDNGSLNLYASGAYGISFAYPDSLLLSEEDIENGCPEEHLITLIQEEHAVPVVAGGEGPVAITIRMCEMSGEGEEAIQRWLLEDTTSNFLLGDGAYRTTEVDGVFAAEYLWSGLYNGETTVFTHDGRLIAVSVTYMSVGDPLRRVYETVLQSLQLR